MDSYCSWHNRLRCGLGLGVSTLLPVRHGTASCRLLHSPAPGGFCQRQLEVHIYTVQMSQCWLTAWVLITTSASKGITCMCVAVHACTYYMCVCTHVFICWCGRICVWVCCHNLSVILAILGCSFIKGHYSRYIHTLMHWSS